MATEYLVKLAVSLSPIIGHLSPEVRVSIPGQAIQTLLHCTKKFELEFTGTTGWLEIQMVNKEPTDQHTAIIIDKIEFFGIHDPKFVWQGQYRPEYPEPWASEQKSTGIVLDSVLSNVTHLGWNGAWRLEFGIPVFTWIHQIQNLGWIHD